MAISNQQYRTLSDEQRLYVMYTQLNGILEVLLRMEKRLPNTHTA